MFKHIKKNSNIYLIITGLAAIFLTGIFIGQASFLREQVIEDSLQKPSLEVFGSKVAETKLLAIDNEGKGVTPLLVTEIRPGSGLVLVNVNDVLAEVDAQYSARLAKQVTENIAGVTLNQTDVIFNIITHANFVGGQSAGSAMALSLLSLVEDANVNKSVMITGAIDANGTILEVGEVYKKSLAAKKAGAAMLLVPVNGSSNLVDYEKIRKCGTITEKGFINESYVGKNYCETRFHERKINIGTEIGLKVIEVANISEAMKYYFT